MSPDTLRTQYEADCEAMKPYALAWDDREKLIISRPADKLSGGSKSQISDGGLSTLAMERAFRVMSQLPSGQVKALSMRDKGKALLMDIILQRYVIPNANWYMDFLTKLRQWDFYSQVYGAMPMIYDWKVRDGYIGPDCRPLPIRDFTPQRGRASVNDCDYVFVDTYHSVRELEAELKNKDSQWDKKALKDIIKSAEAGDKPKENIKMSEIERTRSRFVAGQKGKAARIRLTTKYEAGDDGHWVTFAPDYGDEIVRDIPNPHGTGRIPVILKHSFPMIDSIYGLGDFERGESLQKATDALTNLYFDGVKMSIFRPVIVNPNGVVPHTLKYAPGARWLETIPNSIRPFEVSPQNLNSFQGTVGYLKGALNNNFGTTDTMINSDSASDPSFGKTPAALAMQQQRESSRDNWDRFFMEQALEQLLDGFVCLMSKRISAPIKLHVFDEEIKMIKEAGYDDVNELLQESDSGMVGELYITPEQIQGGDDESDDEDMKEAVEYKYYIEPGTTKSKDDEDQHTILGEVLVTFSKIPNLAQTLQQQGYSFDFGALVRKWVQSSGVEDVDQIITKSPMPAQATDTSAVGQSSDAAGIPNQGQAQPQPQPMPQQPQPQMQQAPGQNFHGQTFTDPHIAAVAGQLFNQQ